MIHKCIYNYSISAFYVILPSRLQIIILNNSTTSTDWNSLDYMEIVVLVTKIWAHAVAAMMLLFLLLIFLLTYEVMVNVGIPSLTLDFLVRFYPLETLQHGTVNAHQTETICVC